MHIYVGSTFSTGAAPSNLEIQERNSPMIMSNYWKYPPNGPSLEIVWKWVSTPSCCDVLIFLSKIFLFIYIY